MSDDRTDFVVVSSVLICVYVVCHFIAKWW